MLKKKIVFITAGIGTGGAEKQLAILAKGLQNRLFEPVIVSLSRSEEKKILPDFIGLRVIHCTFSLGFSLARSFLLLRSILNSEKPDLIQGWMYAGNIVASLAAIGITSNIYHSIRASNMDNERYGRQIWLNAKLSTCSLAVISNSHSGARFHVDRGFSQKKIHTIANGIESEVYRPDRKAGRALRKMLGIRPDEIVFLYVARVDSMKGHQMLTAAAYLCPAIRFIFVGDGTERLNVPKNVLKLGIRSDLFAIYNSADWLLNWSNFGEGFPNVIGEAMACGIPVFANNVGDSWFVLGDTGFKSTANNPQQIAREIKALSSKSISNVERKKTVGRIKNYFSVEKMISAYASAYQGNKTNSSM